MTKSGAPFIKWALWQLLARWWLKSTRREFLPLNHYVTVYPLTCPLTWLISFQYATPLVTDVLVGVCMCARVRCQHFISNRSASGLSPPPHLKDVARRGKAHLCHHWHFNLSLLAILFLSIAHQCLRTNAMGQRFLGSIVLILTAD